MFRNLFNTKISIESREKILTPNNTWISNYKLWNKIWATVSIRGITTHQVLYLFTVKWQPNFPIDFRVSIDGKIFTPTQQPVNDPSRGLIMFHANTI